MVYTLYLLNYTWLYSLFFQLNQIFTVDINEVFDNIFIPIGMFSLFRPVFNFFF